jgi:hypothetical protein
VYVNEEVKHRRTNPGKAAIYAVALLAGYARFALRSAFFQTPRESASRKP